jgi:hypothetical protein
MYCEYLNLGRIRSNHPKEPLKTMWWSMRLQKTLIMQNEPNLNIILTWLTKEIKRTYSDFYQKDAKKTNPILTKS